MIWRRRPPSGMPTTCSTIASAPSRACRWRAWTASASTRGYARSESRVPMPSFASRVAAEFGGSAFLLAVVVGSGVMAERLSAGNDAVALLANSIATGTGLYALIVCLQRFGAQFNPAVTLLSLWRREVGAATAAAAIGAQFAGAVAGVLCVHVMFAQPLFQTGD